MDVRDVMKKIGWWTYAVLATILTLGVFPRFHWVTLQKQKTGGVRAGKFGCVYIYVKDGPPGYRTLSVRKLLTEQSFPLDKIAYADREPGKVRIESSGGQIAWVQSWHSRAVVEFILAQTREHWKNRLHP